MTYPEAMAYLDSLTNYERTHDALAMRQVKLERIQEICHALGDPQRRFRCVLITGTNAKGSMAAMLYSMLRQGSLRVGLYTSPHLEDVRERFRVWGAGPTPGGRTWGDDWISQQELSGLVDEVRSVVDTLCANRVLKDKPTYFEFLTASAFLYFSQRGVQIAVLEVGMGGKFDATNIADQTVSIIGPIDLDHTDVLGEDALAIAKQKAGIIKPNQTVISAPQSDEVMQVLQSECATQGVPFFLCGRDFTIDVHRHDPQGLNISINGLRGVYPSLEIPLLGRHQAQSAASCVAALELLSTLGLPHAMVESGLAQVEWPGRMELVHYGPLVLMDGAHNFHACKAIGKALTELWRGKKMHLLIGVSSDKNVQAIGELLGRLSVSVTCTQSPHPRAMDSTLLAKHIQPFCQDVSVMSDPIDAYTYLLNAVDPSDMIVVTGSLFLVGQIRAALRRSHSLPQSIGKTEMVEERV